MSLIYVEVTEVTFIETVQECTSSGCSGCTSPVEVTESGLVTDVQRDWNLEIVEPLSPSHLQEEWEKHLHSVCTSGKEQVRPGSRKDASSNCSDCAKEIADTLHSTSFRQVWEREVDVTCVTSQELYCHHKTQQLNPQGQGHVRSSPFSTTTCKNQQLETITWIDNSEILAEFVARGVSKEVIHEVVEELAQHVVQEMRQEQVLAQFGWEDEKEAKEVSILQEFAKEVMQEVIPKMNKANCCSKEKEDISVMAKGALVEQEGVGHVQDIRHVREKTDGSVETRGQPWKGIETADDTASEKEKADLEKSLEVDLGAGEETGEASIDLISLDFFMDVDAIWSSVSKANSLESLQPFTEMSFTKPYFVRQQMLELIEEEQEEEEEQKDIRNLDILMDVDAEWSYISRAYSAPIPKEYVDNRILEASNTREPDTIYKGTKGLESKKKASRAYRRQTPCDSTKKAVIEGCNPAVAPESMQVSNTSTAQVSFAPNKNGAGNTPEAPGSTETRVSKANSATECLESRKNQRLEDDGTRNHQLSGNKQSSAKAGALFELFEATKNVEGEADSAAELSVSRKRGSVQVNHAQKRPEVKDCRASTLPRKGNEDIAPVSPAESSKDKAQKPSLPKATEDMALAPLSTSSKIKDPPPPPPNAAEVMASALPSESCRNKAPAPSPKATENMTSAPPPESKNEKAPVLRLGSEEDKAVALDLALPFELKEDEAPSAPEHEDKATAPAELKEDKASSTQEARDNRALASLGFGENNLVSPESMEDRVSVSPDSSEDQDKLLILPKSKGDDKALATAFTSAVSYASKTHSAPRSGERADKQISAARSPQELPKAKKNRLNKASSAPELPEHTRNGVAKASSSMESEVRSKAENTSNVPSSAECIGTRVSEGITAEELPGATKNRKKQFNDPSGPSELMEEIITKSDSSLQPNESWIGKVCFLSEPSESVEDKDPDVQVIQLAFTKKPQTRLSWFDLDAGGEEEKDAKAVEREQVAEWTASGVRVGEGTASSVQVAEGTASSAPVAEGTVSSVQVAEGGTSSVPVANKLEAEAKEIVQKEEDMQMRRVHNTVDPTKNKEELPEWSDNDDGDDDDEEEIKNLRDQIPEDIAMDLMAELQEAEQLEQQQQQQNNNKAVPRPGSLDSTPRKKILPNMKDILKDEDIDVAVSPSSTDLDIGASWDEEKTPDDLATPDALDDSVFGGELNWDSSASATPVDPIPQYSAQEELEDQRSWRTVRIGDNQYKIDLKVIEPYKKVLSHGGYYGDGFNAIIVFAACHLPDKSRRDYHYVMDNLFLYVVSTLELLVVEDYMIIYFHGAASKNKVPGIRWMKRCYDMIDRRLRKNLKSLLIVHPTLWLRTVMLMTKPFISSKFSSKLKYVKCLSDLTTMVPTEYIYVPDEIKQTDVKISGRRRVPQKKFLNL